jgi:hypothetical protein
MSPSGINRLGAALEEISVDDRRMDSGSCFFAGTESPRVDRIGHRVEHLASRPPATASRSPTFLGGKSRSFRRRNSVRDEFE